MDALQTAFDEEDLRVGDRGSERWSALNALLYDPLGARGSGSFGSLRDRFRDVDEQWRPGQPGPGRPGYGDGSRPNLVVFAATRRSASGLAGDIVPEDVFPAALRITVDVFDRGRRLERPIRHVMVLPVGG